MSKINDFLRHRYGSFAANFLYEEGRDELKHASIWWRDIWRLGIEEEGSWFGNNISSILGDGNDIGFWKEKWIGTAPLRELFPLLYNNAVQQDCVISDMGTWKINNWVWNFDWNDALTETEADSGHEIQLILEQVTPIRDGSDRRKWITHSLGFFTVKAAYEMLQNRSGAAAFEHNMEKALTALWLNNVPLKCDSSSMD
ncbi:ribonuclease H [Trifolium pratense]|uniref:Ribonuclease H n=1 Tax=Trifolium pratense TaxID=57577 RepID=A0A2K3NBQ7_TRIPR|nr:ribonuclease H [Trifolium pratense]